MLDVKGLSKSFGKKQVLRDLSLTLDQGIYGLLGANGAGKTTLIRTVAGVYPIQKGEILFQGQSIRNNPRYACALGYLPQEFGMFKSFTATEMLRYFAVLKEIPKDRQASAIAESLERVNLTEQAESRISTLSGGMVRRLGIAQATLGDPKVVILDEPTAGLDPEERSRFKTMLAHLPKDKTVLLSTHIVEDVESICDRILLMEQGRMIGQGTIGEIQAIAVGKVYRVPAELEGQLQAPWDIVKREQMGGASYLRVISPVPQPGEPEQPTAEDGYLCRKKGFG